MKFPFKVVVSRMMPEFAPLTRWQRWAAVFGFKPERRRQMILLDDRTIIVSPRTFELLVEEWERHERTGRPFDYESWRSVLGGDGRSPAEEGGGSGGGGRHANARVNAGDRAAEGAKPEGDGRGLWH